MLPCLCLYSSRLPHLGQWLRSRWGSRQLAALPGRPGGADTPAETGSWAQADLALIGHLPRCSASTQARCAHAAVASTALHAHAETLWLLLACHLSAAAPQSSGTSAVHCSHAALAVGCSQCCNPSRGGVWMLGAVAGLCQRAGGFLSTHQSVGCACLASPRCSLPPRSLTAAHMPASASQCRAQIQRLLQVLWGRADL